MGRKWIFCPNCGDRRWGVTGGTPGHFRCQGCDNDVSMFDAKRAEKLAKASRTASKAEAGVGSKTRRQTPRKPRREIDKAYFLWIKGHYCLVCGSFPVDAHHVVTRARLGSDRTCVPLCHDHHMLLHKMGQDSFQAEHELSFDEEVPRLNAAYDGGEDSPMSHAIPTG